MYQSHSRPSNTPVNLIGGRGWTNLGIHTKGKHAIRIPPMWTGGEHFISESPGFVFLGHHTDRGILNTCYYTPMICKLDFTIGVNGSTIIGNINAWSAHIATGTSHTVTSGNTDNKPQHIWRSAILLINILSLINHFSNYGQHNIGGPDQY